MHAYRIEAVIQQDGSIQLDELPLPPGQRVEVIVLARMENVNQRWSGTLKNSVIKYSSPYESVSEEDWDALQ